MIDRFTVAGIWFWELVALLFHAGRLASMNAAFREHRHWALQAFAQERVLLRAFVIEVGRLETQLVDAVGDLDLEASHHAVATATRVSLRRLQEQYTALVAADLSPEVSKPSV